MRNYVRGIVALSALCFSFGLAEAENKTFENPMIGTNRLDWCADWGKGCGPDAATAWCKTNAYDHSVNVQQAPDIGASAPTKLIATGEVCDQSYCDGFTSITCATADLPVVAAPATPEAPAADAAAPAATPQVAETASEMFKNPEQDGVRLNWCFSGDAGCGKKAAEAWCAQQGFSGAKDFKYVSAIKPTIQIGTGKTNKKAGKAFSRVTCVK
ncbi:MAG: hypothetical protein ABI705_06790 [Aestuariivirga sp.]